MGVTFDKARNKYRASTQVNGKTKHIGRFDTKLKATRALNKFHRDQAEEKLVDDEFEAEFAKIPVDQPMPEPMFDIDFPIGEEKPSLWDKIKSIWQSIRQRN